MLIANKDSTSLEYFDVQVLILSCANANDCDHVYYVEMLLIQAYKML